MCVVGAWSRARDPWEVGESCKFLEVGGEVLCIVLISGHDHVFDEALYAYIFTKLRFDVSWKSGVGRPGRLVGYTSQGQHVH